MGTDKTTFVEVLPEVTLFSYYSCSTSSTRVQVAQVPWLPEVTKGHVTPSGFPWVCAFVTGSCAISALVGPFDRK